MIANELIPIKSIEEKHLVPHLLNKIKVGGSGIIINESDKTIYLECPIVKVTSIINMDLTMFPTSLDSILLNDGDLFALVVQTDLTENGIYIYRNSGIERLYSDFVSPLFFDENKQRLWYLTLANRNVGDVLVYDYIKNTDEKVSIKSGDVAGYLIDKLESSDSSISIVDNGSTVDLTTSAGGLPSGTINQTLRHDGTDWVANQYVTHKTQNTNTIAVFNNAIGQGIYTQADYNAIISVTSSDATNRYNAQFYQTGLGNIIRAYSAIGEAIIKRDGTILSSPLENVSNYLLKANSAGEIVLSTDTEGGGLPSGTLHDTLRYGASGWEASDSIQNKDYSAVINAVSDEPGLLINQLDSGDLLRMDDTTSTAVRFMQDGKMLVRGYANAGNKFLYADATGYIRVGDLSNFTVENHVKSASSLILDSTWQTEQSFGVKTGTNKVHLRWWIYAVDGSPIPPAYSTKFKFVEEATSVITSIMVNTGSTSAGGIPPINGNNTFVPHEHVGITTEPVLDVVLSPFATLFEAYAIITATDDATVNLQFKKNSATDFEMFIMDSSFLKSESI